LLKWGAGALFLLLIAAIILADIALHRAQPYLRARIIEGLEQRFHARVELDVFHVSLVHGLRAEGKGLRIWPPAQVSGIAVPESEGEPLIQLDSFRFHAPLRFRPGKPINIEVVELKGLKVHLPPKSHFHQPPSGDTGSNPEDPGKQRVAGPPMVSFELETLECTGAELVLATSKPGKLPLDFQIARFKLTHIASGGAMGFDAELTNPRPHGTIKTAGSFGPWRTEDPGESLLSGEYRFEHADLADFKGIAGILNSTGRYQGTLRELAVDGQTETPDFRLTHFGNEMNLTTRFHAQVDATNGDTHLENVDATLGHSHFTVKGPIVRVLAPDNPRQSIGHDIALDVNVDRGRIEDFVRLASRGNTPLLTGALVMKTSLHIPPGPAPVHLRLGLKGRFALDGVFFTSAKIQHGIAELSLRGQGRPNDLKTTDPSGILSHMDGNFQLASGRLSLPILDYTVPGARIQMKGTYALDGGALNFAGVAMLEASLSKMVGGWKGLLLKPADRYLKRDGAATEVPILVGGTRQQPKFTIDFDRMKLHEKR